MYKNIRKELDLINSNNQISEKLMILVLYNELYNMFEVYNSLYSDIAGRSENEFLQSYVPFMKKTFELAVASLKEKENVSINAEQFMKIFLQLLKKRHLSNMEPAKEIIPMFENKLKSFVDISECVNIIEKYDTLPLDAKVNIAVQFRDYVNNMFCRSTQFCGEEASSEMRKNILDMSLAKLDDYLRVSIDNGVNHNEIPSSLKSYLKVSTKNYLIGKLKKGEFGLKDFENEVVSEFFEKYNDREQKIWLFAAIYGIAGYDRNDKSIETEQMDEICEFLGISKLKYKKIVFVMGLRTLKNILNQLDIDSTDEKLHKKEKK